jgi:L-amino acid N-acyltransferase YncA
MYARDGFAWLGAAGTLASHRGRGAQGALIARRIDDARALGCHTLTTEILPDQPGKKNASSRNMERVGFRIACRRPNWVFPTPVAAVRP